MTPRRAVVLVHGLWLHGLAMNVLQRRLVREGHVAHAFSYPSIRLDIDANAERLRRYCERVEGDTLDFVGHSLGGLITLAALPRLPRARRGRVVLIGTPYRESFTARRVETLPAGRAMLGRGIVQWLGRAPPDVPEGCEVGVIAGTVGVGMGRIFARGLPKPNDGVVCVDETDVPGMRERITLPLSHSGMLLSARVASQVCAFLARGAFDREPAG